MVTSSFSRVHGQLMDFLVKAAEDALHRVYLTRTPDDQLQLPTSTLGADLFQDETDGTYEAAELPAPEIMYASSGRTGIILGDE